MAFLKYFAIIALIGVVVLSGCVSEQKNTNTATGSSSSSGNGSAPAAQSSTYKVGDKITLGDLSYTVNNIDQLEALGTGYEGSTKTTEGTFYVVELTIENNGNSEKQVTPSNDFVVVSDKGKEYKPSLELAVYAKMAGYEPLSIIEKMSPGVPKNGIIVFEMPQDTTGKLKIQPSLFSGAAEVEFK